MMIFDPLWKTMKEKNVTIYGLVVKHKLSRGTVNKLKHNKNVTIVTIEHLCSILKCQPGDIVAYVEDAGKEAEGKETVGNESADKISAGKEAKGKRL